MSESTNPTIIVGFCEAEELNGTADGGFEGFPKHYVEKYKLGKMLRIRCLNGAENEKVFKWAVPIGGGAFGDCYKVKFHGSIVEKLPPQLCGELDDVFVLKSFKSNTESQRERQGNELIWQQFAADQKCSAINAFRNPFAKNIFGSWSRE
eukprot:TRINITY_DN303690_c0_g1_i1.p1 TRINITY_DN303690_c0_g1~~TRINITY_DN303690_c0_g1_i1.p1  ORF type:complete len:150 (+),score=19.47 TRINITY_DN303690_c0_g1_i1:123-572(+)